MADVKKYYYMRLKENFFDTDEMKFLESMDDGYLYSNILIKLYLKSLKYEGRLLFKDTMPYNSKMIATLTNHHIGIVEKALQAFLDLELITILDNNVMYMNEIELLVGKTSNEADRKREVRKKIASGEFKGLMLEENNGQMSGQMSDKHPPEIRVKSLELRVKSLEKEKPSCLKYEICDMENAKLLFKMMQDNNPSIKEPNFDKWAYDMGLIRRIDKRTDEQIKYLINWTQNDNFWHTNILSPSKLRKKWDQLVLKVKNPNPSSGYQQQKTFRFTEIAQEQDNRWGLE